MAGDRTHPQAPPPAPLAPAPPPPPPPAPFVGAVYVGTNNFGDVGNYVVAFGRAADGTLTPIDAFPTNGAGRGVFRNAGGPIRLAPLASEDSLLAVDDRYLLVVNAGSNTITILRHQSGLQADPRRRGADRRRQPGQHRAPQRPRLRRQRRRRRRLHRNFGPERKRERDPSRSGDRATDSRRRIDPRPRRPAIGSRSLSRRPASDRLRH